MKKIAVLLAISALAFSVAVPLTAATPAVETRVEVTASESQFPMVLCQWETPDDGDPLPGHGRPGTQTLPPVAFGSDKEIVFNAVVTDPQGVESIQAVYAALFFPSGFPGSSSPVYNVQLTRVEDRVESLNAFDSALSEGLVSFSSLSNASEVRCGLDQRTARLYRATGTLSYSYPAGDYPVKIHAEDRHNNWSPELTGCFTYVKVTAAEFDFTTVNYGSVEIGTEKWAGGDGNFSENDGAPTVRNIGNTDLKVTVFQDDMGFEETTGGWNVDYGIRLGLDGTPVTYSPAFAKDSPLPSPAETAVPGIITTGSASGLDFSIKVRNARAGTFNGTMTLGCVEPFEVYSEGVINCTVTVQ